MSENEENSECRACLCYVKTAGCRNIFLPWNAPWSEFGSTIACDLARVANIEVTDSDNQPHMMCQRCCLELYKTCSFIASVQKTDEILQQRMQSIPRNVASSHNSENDKMWPRPIDLQQRVNGDMFRGALEVEIKQEVLSDDNVGVGNEGFGGRFTIMTGNNLEKERHSVAAPSTKVKAKGKREVTNGDDDERYERVEYLEQPLKDEPRSDMETDQALDLPLECLLCAKQFNSVSGLKAHVITQHNYKSVKRKSGANTTPPTKRIANSHVCATCRRAFATPTDLMVHETCHNKSVCYGCNGQFDSNDQLRRHRRRCKVTRAQPTRAKTLEDVIRPPQKNSSKCSTCNETFSDNYYRNIHNEIHHNSRAKSDQTKASGDENSHRNEDKQILNTKSKSDENKELEKELLEHLLAHEHSEPDSNDDQNTADVKQNSEHERKTSDHIVEKAAVTLKDVKQNSEIKAIDQKMEKSHDTGDDKQMDEKDSEQKRNTSDGKVEKAADVGVGKFMDVKENSEQESKTSSRKVEKANDPDVEKLIEVEQNSGQGSKNSDLKVDATDDASKQCENEGDIQNTDDQCDKSDNLAQNPDNHSKQADNQTKDNDDQNIETNHKNSIKDLENNVTDEDKNLATGNNVNEENNQLCEESTKQKDIESNDNSENKTNGEHINVQDNSLKDIEDNKIGETKDQSNVFEDISIEAINDQTADNNKLNEINGKILEENSVEQLSEKQDEVRDEIDSNLESLIHIPLEGKGNQSDDIQNNQLGSLQSSLNVENIEEKELSQLIDKDVNLETDIMCKLDNNMVQEKDESILSEPEDTQKIENELLPKVLDENLQINS